MLRRSNVEGAGHLLASEKVDIIKTVGCFPINPGDEITTIHGREYKADIKGRLFRVPAGSLGRDE